MITEITLITIATLLLASNALTLFFHFRLRRRNQILENNAGQEVQRILGELLTDGYGVFEIQRVDHTQFYLKR